MTGQEAKKHNEAGHTPPLPEDSSGNTDSPGENVSRGMTLESLVTLTGEMGHLNELVLLHVEKAGGFTCTASYLTIVTPVLDMLEGEIRFRYRDGMTHEEIKFIIAQWIDQEISGMQPCQPGAGEKRESE